MKINCSMTENYLKEKARMTKDCQIACRNCYLRKTGHEEDFYSTILCKGNIKEYIEEAIVIVQQWSDEHPQKTWKDKLKEALPNMPVDTLNNFICGYLPFNFFGVEADGKDWSDFFEENNIINRGNENEM